MKFAKYFICLLVLFSAASLFAKSDLKKQFDEYYNQIDADLLASEGEEFVVKNFVYEKDLALFTFEEGVIHLLRFVDGRPTTALFQGKGKATIRIPSDAERRSLESVSGKDHIDDEFELCIIRFADDFDLAVKSLFDGQKKKLKWKDFSKIKQEQSDYFFKPVIQHTYDNKFQQVRSLFERAKDGFFWIDFNRYNFTYDPNRPEQVVVSYEFETNDFAITEAAVLQKREYNRYDNLSLSDIDYPVTAVSKNIILEMGGSDGTKMKLGQGEISLVVNVDSIRFLSTFLDRRLKTDSVYFNNAPVDFKRRKDFKFTGIMLPEYKYKGDTLNFTMFYRGDNFIDVVPYVEDPTPTEISVNIIAPEGFNYIVPGMGEQKKIDNKKVSINVKPDEPYNHFRFQGYASGFDTLTKTSDLGLPVNFVQTKSIRKSMACFVPDDLYEESILSALNFMTLKVGSPIAVDQLFIYPGDFVCMPGLVGLPKLLCYTEGSLTALGGLDLFAGDCMANQWFGYLTKPATQREYWLKDAAGQYLSMMYIQSKVSNDSYFSNLILRRDSLYTMQEVHRERMLSSGERTPKSTYTNKGVWMFHMLRYLMLDLDKMSESKFNRFMYELAYTVNNQQFKNKNIIELAEKYYGQDLDWFFDQWLFGYGNPTYKVEYSIDSKADGYYVNGTVNTLEMPDSFTMPVMLRIKYTNDGATFHRESFASGENSFSLGPFASEPKELIFNELYSVLSRDDVKKR